MLIRMARRVALILLTLALVGCANGYKQFYQARPGAELIGTTRTPAPGGNPQVERRSGNAEATKREIEKRGYVLIGYSNFTSGRNEAEDGAVQQAKDVGADLVAIMAPQYAGSEQTTMPITMPTSSTTFSTATATAYGSRGPVTAFGNGMSTTYGSTTSFVPVTIHRQEYMAGYFIRWKPRFGAQFRDLSDAERREHETNKGAIITVVVDGSPAFDADILTGDIVTRVDEQPVLGYKSLQGLLSDRNGKKVRLSLIRKGKHIEKDVQMREAS